MGKGRLLIVILLLSVIFSPTVMEGRKNESGKRPLFDYMLGEPGNRVCLRLPRSVDSIKALLYCHQNMTEEVLFRSPLFTGKMDSLGVAMALADPRPAGGVYYSRWNEDGTETDDPHEQFWYQDREMADMTRSRYRESIGKKMQYVGAKVNGNIVPYDTTKHIKMSVNVDGDRFRVEPVFLNEERSGISKSHADVKPRVTLISGPAIQTEDCTFIVDRDYFGTDPHRLWTGVTVCIEADGDETYKSAVQELNIQLNALNE